MKKIICLFVCLFASAANATIVQLADPSGLSLSNNFENSVDNTDATFSSTSQALASSFASSVTPSGIYGISNNSSIEPLVGNLSSPTTAMGIWFGNDDFNLTFDAILEVFNGATSLGSIRVQSNANDFADQFLGLSSTVAFDSFQVSYERPNAQGLYIYLDDLYLGESSAPIPEPASLALLGLGLAGIGFSRKRKLT